MWLTRDAFQSFGAEVSRLHVLKKISQAFAVLNNATALWLDRVTVVTATKEGQEKRSTGTCSFSIFFFIAADLFGRNFTKLYLKSRQALPTDEMAKRLESSIRKYAGGESVIDRRRRGWNRLHNVKKFIEFRNRKTSCLLQIKVTVSHFTLKENTDVTPKGFLHCPLIITWNYFYEHSKNCEK
jgi:hypothetical protein